MNTRKPMLAAAACLFLSTQPSPADTIILKNGESVRGNVIREDAESYTVEIKVGTIRDEKVFPKADVSRIEKEKADDKAFREIEGLSPAPELLGKEGYEARMKKIEGFIKDYPDSAKAAAAAEMLEALAAEYAIVAAGGIKFGEEMVTVEAYEANAYEYDVKIAERRIKDDVARRDLLGALRKFTEFGERYGEPPSYQGIATLMLQVLQAYRNSLQENLASLESRTEKRQAGLAVMANEDRAKTERALKEQMEKVQANYQEEKSSGQKWVTPDSFHKESMDEALRQVVAETARLEGRPAAVALEMPHALAYRTAWAALADASDEEKKKILDDAKQNRLSEYYLEKLRVRADLPQN
ncbi:hypothetical protein HZ994_17025 [Akkermansiaceae bacterium]|nr:hypothetical protein HZ994_17025 [Akkermansiaceae bacterium]